MNKLVRIIVLTMFLLVSCQPMSTPTVLPTSNLSVQNTPPSTLVVDDGVPEDDHFPEPTIIPSDVPISAIDVSTVFELPEWVINSDNDLVLFMYDDSEGRSSKVGFVNPVDGEQVLVKLPHKIYQYYWEDANHIAFLLEGYCEDAPKYAAELDIAQSTFVQYDAKDYPDVINKYCHPSNDSQADSLRLNTDLREPTIEIMDAVSGQNLRLTDMNDGISDITYEISPNKDYVAVVQIEGEFQFPELWQPLFGNRISIYNLHDRKPLVQYDEAERISTQLLFTDNENLIYLRENTPCIITISSLSKKCIHNVSDKFPNTTIILGDPLTEPSKLSFLYFGFDPHHGGYCFYDLFSGEIDCPTDYFETLKDQVVINYALSPSEKYLLIEYDYKGCPAPWCDYAGDPQLAVINLKGHQIFELGSTNVYQALDIFRLSKPWRPKP